MKKYNFFIFILIALIIATLSVLIYFGKKKAEFIYCDPATPRGNDLAKWHEIITPKQKMTHVDNDFFDKIEVVTDTNEITVQYPTSTGSPEDPFPYEIREMTPGQSLEIGDGTLEFLGLGVSYPDANHISNENVPYKFFDANFQPEKAEIIDDIWTYNQYESDSRFRYYPSPYVNIAFRYEGIEDILFTGIKVFDAQTKKLLSTGHSHGGIHNNDWTGHQFKTNLPLWQYTPIDVVIDVSFGPSKIYEFPPEIGEGFKLGDFECRLISVLDDIDISHSRNSSYENKSVIGIFKAAPNAIGSSFIFACHPTASKMPLSFSFLTKDGEAASGIGGSTSGYINENRLHAPLNMVDKIQAKYRANRYRIIVHLPYIPGLPEQNKNIENLFDVHIPYVKLYDINQFNDFINKTLQLKRSKTIGRIPSQNTLNNQYPIVFTDVTVRDIIKTNTAGATINVDMENDNLEIKYPEPFLTKLKMLFYRIKQPNSKN